MGSAVLEMITLVCALVLSSAYSACTWIEMQDIIDCDMKESFVENIIISVVVGVSTLLVAICGIIWIQIGVGGAEEASDITRAYFPFFMIVASISFGMLIWMMFSVTALIETTINCQLINAGEDPLNKDFMASYKGIGHAIVGSAVCFATIIGLYTIWFGRKHKVQTAGTEIDFDAPTAATELQETEKAPGSVLPDD